MDFSSSQTLRRILTPLLICWLHIDFNSPSLLTEWLTYRRIDVCNYINGDDKNTTTTRIHFVNEVLNKNNDSQTERKPQDILGYCVEKTKASCSVDIKVKAISNKENKEMRKAKGKVINK
jgi:hypothetical protein